MLDACEAAAGDGPLPVHQVLDAFLRPVFEMLEGPARAFTPIMSRLFTESSELTKKVFDRHLAHVAQRFLQAFHRPLPVLPHADLLWRFQFTMGPVSHTLLSAKLPPAL